MCLTTPGRIVSLEPDGAIVDVDGRQRWASTALFSDLKIGDYVLISALTILDHLDLGEAEAMRNLARTLLEGEL
jgi:hydrogenase assembly chaperone HypC/HupF